jgi:hypothetical protein
MIAAYRLIGLGAACAAILCGCGSSSYTAEYGSDSVAKSSTTGAIDDGTNPGGFSSESSSIDGTHDAVVATPPSQLVSVEVGTTKTVSVTITSSDGRTITGFAISNPSGDALPAEWTAPAMFGCKSLSTGSGCVLNLTFAPAAYEIGQTLTLHYVYVDNAMEPVTTDSFTLNYQATTNDNVAATLAPIGQINATVNAGSQTVTAAFVTDDGHPASGLTITSDPAALPPGWSAPGSSACATVSAGTACQLAWVYAPTAPGNGTIAVDYSYDDDSGTPKTGTFNIPYAATANDNVAGAVSPSSISVASQSSAPILITFTTDDGFLAGNLSMNLTNALPAGWSAPSNSFTCAAISTGTGCQLALTFAPTSANPAQTFQLNYSYLDNAGAAKTGSVNIAYAST